MLTLAWLWPLVSALVLGFACLAMAFNRHFGVIGLLALTLISAACLSIPLMV